MGAKLLVALAALGVSAILCEGMARAFYQAPPNMNREPPVMYQNLRGVGFVQAPNQRGWIDDGVVTTNALGLRGAEPIRPKPAGIRRVLAIGDSTTLGWGVNDEETYPVQLESRFRAASGAGWDVVNAGVSGYDLHRETRLLAYLAPMLQPDIVVVGVLWNDLPYERISPDGAPVAADPGALSGGSSGDARVAPQEAITPQSAPVFTSSPFRIGGSPTGLNRVLRSSRLLYVLRQSWVSLVAPTRAGSNQLQWEAALLEGRRSAAIDGAWRDVESSLREIGRLGQQYGFEVMVMVMPIRAQVERPYPNAAYQTRLREISESLGMPVIDPLPRFAAESDRGRLFVPYDRMHFSAAGNACLADAAFEAMQTFRATGRSGAGHGGV
jgi:hypothetical protein